jgi:two-component system LytT family response regulator
MVRGLALKNQTAYFVSNYLYYMPYKITIIEDEPAIARELTFLLNEIDNSIEILQTLGSVKEATDWLKVNIEKCDLLFLDIQLSDGISFEIFNYISPSIPVVFITAYDEYALEAFKLNSIDYILKPFDKSHIEKALTKFRSTLQSYEDHYFDVGKITKMLDYFKTNTNKDYKKVYLVNFKDKLIPLSVANINWFYTEHEIVYAHTIDNKKFVIDATLEQIISDVSPDEYYRANRQYIISRKAIIDINFYFNGRLIVNVFPKPQEKIIVSKAKASDFKKWMDQ